LARRALRLQRGWWRSGVCKHVVARDARVHKGRYIGRVVDGQVLGSLQVAASVSGKRVALENDSVALVGTRKPRRRRGRRRCPRAGGGALRLRERVRRVGVVVLQLRARRAHGRHWCPGRWWRRGRVARARRRSWRGGRVRRSRGRPESRAGLATASIVALEHRGLLDDVAKQVKLGARRVARLPSGDPLAGRMVVFVRRLDLVPYETQCETFVGRAWRWRRGWWRGRRRRRGRRRGWWWRTGWRRARRRR
jgi:hypothetical protein